MANREALRELQTRLANRLKAARTEGVSVSWLAVRAGEGNYLFPLALSGEIFPLTSLQVVPYSRQWFMGVINLRGGLYGVVDLARFMAIGTAPVRTEQSLAESSVITFNSALELNCAVMVDGLAGLRKREAFSEAVAPPAGSPVYFGNKFTDLSGVQWQEINLRTLSQFPEFLSISA
ncbi:MAG: chemotaxis protein CheW [Rhodoferax sp.]|jgi:twitching motility protein PilI|nr:chemotaxis protein CheW [Rhodoferax sp.]MBP9059232.1 chemotaxis protein CheW [Rhodoferax sp.]MBP9683774.1 chemotaxis protein CheW [Rhodoferax sp.]